MTVIPDDTPMTDRQLLLHTLAHVEDMADQLGALHDLLEIFGPMIKKFAPAGKADMLTIMQARRDLRKGARNGR